MDEKREHRGLPVLSARGETIPEAWENSVVELYHHGLRYGREGPKDKGQMQLDSTMMIEIAKPLSWSYMHKFMTCGWEDLFEYQMELLGAKDSWVDPTEQSTRWEYHYHERLAGYPGRKGKVDQLQTIIEKLATEPHKRNINAITWVPERDLTSKDPPCLQRIWFTMIPNEADPDSPILNMNYNFRSRNVMIAAPMNQLGLATLQTYIAEEVAKRTGKPLKVGRMVDFSDAYHVSARDQPIIEKFMKKLGESRAKGETIGNRSYDIEFVLPMLEEAQSRIEEKTIAETREIVKGEELEREIAKIKEISARVMQINRNIAA